MTLTPLARLLLERLEPPPAPPPVPPSQGLLEASRILCRANCGQRATVTASGHEFVSPVSAENAFRPDCDNFPQPEDSGLLGWYRRGHAVAREDHENPQIPATRKHHAHD